MTIAILATLASDQVSGLGWIIIAMVVGGAIGVFFAIRVQMTQMPELVAMMHSFVGLAAVMVGYASFLDPELKLIGAEKTVIGRIGDRTAPVGPRRLQPIWPAAASVRSIGGDCRGVFSEGPVTEQKLNRYIDR